MAQTQTIRLKVKYQDHENDLQFDRDATVEDLKLRLFSNYKIKPSKQQIIGWLCMPENDDEQLRNIISNEPLTLHNLDRNHDEVYAAESFIRKYRAAYGEPRVDFFSGSIDEALAHSCYADEESKKVLLIYLHKENDPFSNFFCPLLTQNRFHHTIQSKFLLLALDTEVDFDNSALKQVIRNHNDFPTIENYISAKTAMLFFIVPFDANIVHVFSYLCGEISEDVLLTILESSMEFVRVQSNSYEPQRLIDFENNAQEGDGELEAIFSFKNGFHAEYGSEHVPFQECSLEDALSRSCLTETNDKKILALYFHNNTKKFSQILCPKLAQGRVRQLLTDNCLFLPWDVSRESCHNSLKRALDIHEELAPLRIQVGAQGSALFLLHSIENMITIHAVLYGKLSESDLIKYLEDTVKTQQGAFAASVELRNLNQEFDENVAFTSTRYQQLMFDNLGDRDYDAFESAEHTELKGKIGFAYFGPPKSVDGYDVKQNKQIEKAYKKICGVNNRYTEYPDKIIISVIYNVLEPLPAEKLKRAKKYADYNPLCDVFPQPIFVLQKCKDSVNPCRMFIDHDLRVYDSWNNYIWKNNLHECIMVLPKDGRYQGNDNGEVVLEQHLSPKCSVSHKILVGLDITSTVVGLVSGGIFMASMVPAITFAPVVLIGAGVAGAGVGVYAIGRSIASLVDRSTHEQDMSFANSEARGAYINIVAGAMGFVGAGATTAVSQMVSSGIRVPQSAQAAVTAINIANIGTSGVGVANSTYNVIYQWWNEDHAPSWLTIVQLSSSVLFFGHAVYSFKPTSVLIEETQAGIIKDYQEGMRSNRHRKTFRKLELETIRMHNGDPVAGRNAVISTIRKIPDKNEVFAVLTRSNKNFNQNKVRFAAGSNGEITLNGRPVDMGQFGAMTKSKQTQFLIDLPPTPNSSTTQVVNTTSIVNTVCKTDNLALLGEVATMCTGGLVRLLDCYSPLIQEKLLYILKYVVDFVELDNCLSELISKTLLSDKIITILQLVINFCKEKMNDYERQYQEDLNLARANGNFNEREFNARYNVHPDTARRAMDFFERAVFGFFNQGKLLENAARNMIKYLTDWLVGQVYRIQEDRERPHTARLRSLEVRYMNCEVCTGKYLKI